MSAGNSYGITLVNGAAVTYTIFMELGIGEESEEDCAGCRDEY